MARFSGPKFPRDSSSRKPGAGQESLFDPSEYQQPEVRPVTQPFDNPAHADDWDYYWPTQTSNPERPRTEQARYSKKRQRLEVIFRDGTPWHYSEVHPTTWRHFRRNPSPGKFINSYLNGHPYGRGGWGMEGDD